jgi:hypothetical protein
MIYSTFVMIKMFSIFGFILVFTSILLLYVLTQIFKSKPVIWATSILLMILYETVILKHKIFVRFI